MSLITQIGLFSSNIPTANTPDNIIAYMKQLNNQAYFKITDEQIFDLACLITSQYTEHPKSWTCITEVKCVDKIIGFSIDFDKE